LIINNTFQHLFDSWIEIHRTSIWGLVWRNFYKKRTT